MPKSSTYVEDLQDQLAQLRNNGGARLPDDLVQQYLRHVEHLSEKLLTPDIPLYCKTLPKDVVQKPPEASTSSREQTHEPDVFRTFGRMIQGSKLGDEAKEKLQMQSEIQDDLTDDLLKLAKDLKTRTVAMETALTHRDAAMTSTAEALEYSTAAAKAASRGAAKQYKMSRMGTCRMLMILLFVGCGFTGMIFFIRITSLLGYRSRTEL